MNRKLLGTPWQEMAIKDGKWAVIRHASGAHEAVSFLYAGEKTVVSGLTEAEARATEKRLDLIAEVMDG